MKLLVVSTFAGTAAASCDNRGKKKCWDEHQICVSSTKTTNACASFTEQKCEKVSSGQLCVARDPANSDGEYNELHCLDNSDLLCRSTDGNMCGSPVTGESKCKCRYGNIGEFCKSSYHCENGWSTHDREKTVACILDDGSESDGSQEGTCQPQVKTDANCKYSVEGEDKPLTECQDENAKCLSKNSDGDIERCTDPLADDCKCMKVPLYGACDSNKFCEPSHACVGTDGLITTGTGVCLPRVKSGSACATTYNDDEWKNFVCENTDEQCLKDAGTTDLSDSLPTSIDNTYICTKVAVGKYCFKHNHCGDNDFFCLDAVNGFDEAMDPSESTCDQSSAKCRCIKKGGNGAACGLILEGDVKMSKLPCEYSYECLADGIHSCTTDYRSDSEGINAYPVNTCKCQKRLTHTRCVHDDDCAGEDEACMTTDQDNDVGGWKKIHSGSSGICRKVQAGDTCSDDASSYGSDDAFVAAGCECVLTCDLTTKCDDSIEMLNWGYPKCRCKGAPPTSDSSSNNAATGGNNDPASEGNATSDAYAVAKLSNAFSLSMIVLFALMTQ